MSEWIMDNFPDSISNENRIVIPVDTKAVLGFFGYICTKASNREEADAFVEDGETPLSVSCVKGYRSALVDLYRKEYQEFDPDLNTKLKTFLDGYEKVINNLKKRGRMKIVEGKRYLKSNGYTLLANKLMKQEPDSCTQSWSMVTFGWSYFVLMWNLMSRTDSVDTIMLQHIEWAEDSLVIEEQGHKGDQTGVDKFGKHVYANPYEPEKCPILAFAVLLFSYPNRPERGKQQLFSGTNSKDRFGKILRRILSSFCEEDYQILGCPPEDIGSHSIRKGSSTYALGHVNGPTPVSVFLRMGQSLGKLKDRYIHSGEGADQLCGRMVAGLPFNEDRFGVLPPHFDTETSTKLNQEYWNEIVPGFRNYPNGVRSAFSILLATLFHHEAFLRNHLNVRHPIFLARVFSQNRLLDQLRGKTILGIGRCKKTGMKATGIPPHLAISSRLQTLSMETKSLQIQFDELKSNLMSRLPIAIAGKVADEIRENFSIDGVSPLSIRDLDSRMDTFRCQIVQEMRSFVSDSAVINTNTLTNEDGNVFGWRTWDWGDGLICHFVPQNWNFPDRITTKTLWDLWNFGNRETGVRPYRLLNKKVDIKSQHRMKYTRAKVIMDYIDSLIRKMALLQDGVTSITKLSVIESDSIFEKVYAKLLVLLYDGKKTRRTEEISYGRIYNLLCMYKKK